jgi:TolB-like protein/DNA-binding winged helix-turn-helix (wHTH) protein
MQESSGSDGVLHSCWQRNGGAKVAVSPVEDVLRFGLFELDVKAEQLRKDGIRIRLSQQPVQLLTILLERPGEVITREELRQRLWPADVFIDFDHGLNKSVQKLRDALGDSADSPRYIETIPRIGYRFIAPVGGSGSLSRDEADAKPLSSTHHAPARTGDPGVLPQEFPKSGGYRMLWLMLAGCAVLLAIGTGWLIHRRQQRGAPIHSLAVLPLDNLSGDKEQDYFADGMTDELTTMLAKDSTLRIVSRTSAMQYKGVHKPLGEIAQELGVEGIVEGSVERSGDKVHMTLQLIHGPSDTHVWAESYDREANDLVSLPDEAAMAIAKKTKSAVAERAPVRYVKPEAHDAYLHGRYLWFAGRNDEAGKYFQKAVELQPDYALAWSGVADYYTVGTFGTLDPREGGQLAEAAGQKAVDLDDSLPEAHNTLCGINFFIRWNLVGADRECVRATDLNPKFAEAYHLRAKVLSALNRHEEAIASQKKAMEIDPFARPWGLAYIYLLGRQYDAALAEAHQRLESDPHNSGTLYVLAAIYRCKGMEAEAAKFWEQGLIEAGNMADAATIRRALEQGGYPAVLRWNIANLKKQSEKHYVSPVDMALQYAQLGDRVETLRLLEEAYQQHSPDLIDGLQDDPAYDFLHSDPRYRSLIQRIGLPPAY